jgi:predicted DNA-binding transcriptional regulator YafY
VTDTAGRLLRLLALLQRQVTWTGPDLAERLGVDTRTVRRDVERIRALGYVVDSSPGTAGGYRLGIGAEMPPLLLDEEEAMAVAVLLGVSASTALPGIERATLATLARIDRLLPPKLQRQVKALRAATVPLVRPPEPLPVAELAPLAQACEGHEVVSFNYSSRGGDKTARRVEPYRLVATTRLWYLVAFDLNRIDWRTFRVDRLKQVRLTGHTFEPRHLADAGRLVADAINSTPYRYQAQVMFPGSFDKVARLVPPNVGTVEPSGNGALVRIGADDVDWLAGYLIGLALPFEILSPAVLRDQVRDLAERILRAHAPL